MTRLIELEVEGVVVKARLLDDQAAETCRRVWELLPLQRTVTHVSWAGEAAFIKIEELEAPNFPLENRVSFYVPGTINYRPENVEVAFGYGQAQARTLLGNGGNVWANHFATLEGETGAFLAKLEATNEEGIKQLQIRRSEA